MSFHIKPFLFMIFFLIDIPFPISSEGAAYSYFQNGNEWENSCPEVKKKSNFQIPILLKGISTITD